MHTRHETSITTCGGVFALAELVNSGGEESGRARTRDVERSANAAEHLGSLAWVWIGFLRLIAGVRKTALLGSSHGVERSESVLGRGHVVRVGRILEPEKEVSGVCDTLETARREFLFAAVEMYNRLVESRRKKRVLIACACLCAY